MLGLDETNLRNFSMQDRARRSLICGCIRDAKRPPWSPVYCANITAVSIC